MPVWLIASEYTSPVANETEPLPASTVPVCSIAGAPDAPPVLLRPDTDAKAWMFVRLTHAIPEYRGVKMGDRVRLVGPGEPADFTIARDGRLSPAR